MPIPPVHAGHLPSRLVQASREPSRPVHMPIPPVHAGHLPSRLVQASREPGHCACAYVRPRVLVCNGRTTRWYLAPCSTRLGVVLHRTHTSCAAGKFDVGIRARLCARAGGSSRTRARHARGRSWTRAGWGTGTTVLLGVKEVEFGHA